MFLVRPPPPVVTILVSWVPFFFMALICSYRRLISFFLAPLCLLRSRGSLIILQVGLFLWQLVLLRPRQCCQGSPQASLASDLAVVLAQKKLYALFDAAAFVCRLLCYHQRVCPLLTWILLTVSLPHTPSWTLFSTPSMFVGHQEVLTTSSFRFNTHPI